MNTHYQAAGHRAPAVFHLPGAWLTALLLVTVLTLILGALLPVALASLAERQSRIEQDRRDAAALTALQQRYRPDLASAIRGARPR